MPWLMDTMTVSTNTTLGAMLPQLKNEDSPNKANTIAVRPSYLLPKRTAL